VLVVDDDPTNREFLRTLLVHLGHTVCEAEDGESALSIAGRQPPDAVITDVLMPGLDGYELARLLRSRPETSRIPIAFSTAHYSRHEIERLARTCGVKEVIVKPAHPRVVLAALDSLLSAGPLELPPSTVEEFADEHRLALKTKLFEKAAALGLSEGRLRAIVHTTRAGVLLAHDDGAATYVNARLTEITGRPREALLRLGWLDCLDASDRDRLRAAILQGVPSQGCEHRVLAPHGPQPKWLGIRMQPMEDGYLERLVVVVEDVTETVRAQQRVATAESREAGLRHRAGRLAEQLSETQRVTHAGTWGLDPRTGVIELSLGLRELLRLPSSAVRQEVLWQRVHPDDLERAMAMAERTLRTGRPQIVELRVADLDGMVHELIVSCRIATPQPDSNRNTRSLWGVTHDVTEAREERIRLQMRADWRAQRRVLDRMQLAMFPRDLPEVAGADLAAAYVAAPERLDNGGDWYDVLPVGDGMVLSIGDVAGQDTNPIAVMGPIRAVLRAFALEDPDPARVLLRLNRFLLSAGYGDSIYVTAVVAYYEPSPHRLVVANAGHPCPLLLEPSGATSVTEPGPALGILSSARFTATEMTLEPGMALCAYTDGLTDPHIDLTDPSEQRLHRLAFDAYQQLSPEALLGVPIAQRLLDDLLQEMLAGSARDDDLCLAILRAT
jgi:PAS domain S-box-containing protein